MIYANAAPNEYLVVGRGGKVVNRGTGIRVFLWPGSTAVIVPSTKQEAAFEMTQETKDGIPLRFKGSVIYRIIDPVAAATNFNFYLDQGLEEINLLIRNICLGELRATVSHMTMQECIEQRKTTLTTAVENALKQVVPVSSSSTATGSSWGIQLEVVQVAQVFIVDAHLRQQLEAEVRNAIRASSDQSDIRTQEEVKLTQLASEQRLLNQKLEAEKEEVQRQEEIEQAQIASEQRLLKQKLEAEKEGVRRKEEIDLAKIASERRLLIENQETELQEINLARARFLQEQAAEQEKIETESPVRMLQVEKQKAILQEEVEMRKLENQIHELAVMRDMLIEKARQELRMEMLPIEQAPLVAESLSKALQDAHLSVYGGENLLMSLLSPVLDYVTGIIRQSTPSDEA